MENIYYILISAIAYLVGSFPTAYLVVRFLCGKDIRKFGSKNVGALNTHRILKEYKGERIALIGFLIVLLIDLAKGVGVVIFAQKFIPHSILSLFLASFFVVLGHNYSIFLKFDGGRGAACIMGILLYMDPLSLLMWGLPVLFTAILTQYILAKKGLEKKINYLKISELFSVMKTQMLGRIIGLIIGTLVLYFFNKIIFYSTVGAMILLLVRNKKRLENYLNNLK